MSTSVVPETVTGLTPQQARLYSHLRQHGPCPAKAMLLPVTGRRFGDENCIVTHVYRMRPLLKPLGLTIARTRKHGYALTAVRHDR